MRFGVWLPSYAYPDRDPSRMARLRRYVLEVENAGHDLW